MFKYSNGEESNILKPSKDLVKWTNGDKYEKSFKKEQESTEKYDEIRVKQDTTNDHPNKDERFIQQGFVLKQNKREAFNDKLLERGFQTQVSQNPFLAGGSYLSDIEIEDNFLRPKNTNTLNIELER